MKAIMQDMMKDMAGMAGGQQTIRISGGPMGGPMQIRKRVELPADDDDEDDGIPPEILQMMAMTEAMHMRPSIFGGPPMFRKKEKEEPIIREDEAKENIMDRMNKLTEEIGDKHSKKKYQKIESKSERLFQILVIGGLMVLMMLGSFAINVNAKVVQEDGDKPVDG